MTRLVALTERTEAQRWAEVRDEEALWGDLRPELCEAVRTILEATMEDELAAEVMASRYERTYVRRDVRNGGYHRTLVALSPTAVSRLARRLDAQVAAFHRRPLAFPARYLLLDGLWVSVRGNGRAAKRVILAAYAMDEHGRRELLDYVQATSESAAAWRRLVGSMVGRGLDPEAIELVTADGAGGIAAAVGEAFPAGPACSAAGRTACGTSSRRSRAPSRSPVCAACGGSYRAPTRRAAVAADWAAWARAWRKRHPVLVRRLEEDLDELLAVFALPPAVRPSLDEPDRALLSGALLAAPSDRRPVRPPVSRSDPLRPGPPPQRSPGRTPARCISTRVLTSSWWLRLGIGGRLEGGCRTCFGLRGRRRGASLAIDLEEKDRPGDGGV